MAFNPRSPPETEKSPSFITLVSRRQPDPNTSPHTEPHQEPKESKKESVFVLNAAPRRNDRTNRPTPVAPYSTHKGPHREGYSEFKCRTVLVRECSRIPRNFNYLDGYHKVVEILRFHLGDENLDLAIGVLYEFIEVNDTTDTWEEGSAYRRWSHDHSLRNEDFCCPHTLRLRTIVVGNIQPTERLRQWRQHKIQQMSAAEGAGVSSFSQSLETPAFGPMFISHGIRNRHSWQINYSIFVSSPSGGTNVMYCPTPTRLNEVAFNEGIARGQRHHAGMLPSPLPQVVTAPPIIHNMPDTPPPSPPPPPPTVVEGESSIWKKGFQAVLSLLCCGCCLKPAKTAEDVIDLTETAAPPAGSSHNIVNDTNKVAELKSPMRAYTDEDGTIRMVLESVSLPPTAKVNGVFLRKFGLLDYEEQLPEEVANAGLCTAEDKVLKDEIALRIALIGRTDTNTSTQNSAAGDIRFKGPFTADLFKDGGLDFKWKPATATVVEEADVISPGTCSLGAE